MRGDPPGLLDQAGAAAETVGDLLGDFRLDGEEVLVGAVPAFRPQIPAGPGIDELRRNPNAVGISLDRALDHKTDLERGADRARIDRLALVGPGRIAGDHAKLGEARQIGDDILGEAVGQPARGRIIGEMVERQHGDDRLDDWRGVRPEPPGSHDRQSERQGSCSAQAGPT